MHPSTRNALFGLGAVLILLVGVVIGVVAKGHHGSGGAGLTPSPSPSVLASPSLSPSPSPSPSVSPSPSPSPSLPAGTPASSAGALLTSSSTTQSNAPDGIDCSAIGDAGWAVSQCEAYTFSDTVRKAFLIEHKAPAPGQHEAWQAMVMHYDYTQDLWIRDLSFSDLTGAQVSSVKAVVEDLTNDGKPEIVFGYRLQGSGSYLAYDVVTTLIGVPTVAVHRELGHGSAIVAKGVVTDYQGLYGSQGVCCPVSYQESQISFGVQGWQVQTIATTKTEPAGQF